MNDIRLSRPARLFCERLAEAWMLYVAVTIVWIVYAGWGVR